MKSTKFFPIICLLAIALAFSSCSDDDIDPTAKISINEGPEPGDIGGDFTGNGGSTTDTFQLPNQLSTADYNADFTATSTGTFQMIIKDNDGMVVLDRGLTGNQDVESFSGVTSCGAPGTWSVTI